MNYQELHEYVNTNEKNIVQMVCYKKNELVYNDTWHDFKDDDAVHVMSVTKSIVSLLIGIAIDQGLIKSIDQHVLDFFPNYQIKRGEKTIQEVTLRHLLTMTAPYKYKYEPWVKICTSPDWTIKALDFLGGRKGITNEFKYSTLGIHILTGIISITSKMPVVEFANKFLFKYLDIPEHKNFFAMNAMEHKEFTISKEPKENVWFADPKGVGTAGYGLCISAVDLAKIGIMCINKGKYRGKQIVSEKWLLESTSTHMLCNFANENLRYGYLWWIIDDEKKVYAALGNSGNVLYINNEKEIVVSITGTFLPKFIDRISFINNIVEPFLEKGESHA